MLRAMPNITLGWEIASTTESLVMTAVMLWKAISKKTDSELKRKNCPGIYKA
jgi:hypothetical protein